MSAKAQRRGRSFHPARLVTWTTFGAAVVALLLLDGAAIVRGQFFFAQDPGVRGGAPGAGGALAGLTTRQLEFFQDGQADFVEVEAVADGLGPRMNLDSCGGCHAQPAVGGTSPLTNPQVAFATRDGGTNPFPSAVIFSGGYNSPIGPVREVDSNSTRTAHATAASTTRRRSRAGRVQLAASFRSTTSPASSPTTT